MMEAPEQVVEDPEAQRAIRIGHALDAQFLENRRHDGHPTREHRQAVALDARQIQRLGGTRLDQQRTQAIQTLAGDPGFAIGVEIVHLEDVCDGPRRPRRPHRFLPAQALVIVGNQFDFLGRGDLRLAQTLAIEAPVAEKSLRIADTAHIERLHQHRIMALADDEFGRPAPDIDHQALVRRRRQ